MCVVVVDKVCGMRWDEMAGMEHEMASWKQNEWKSYRDDGSRPRR
jgi:hypothetical protein